MADIQNPRLLYVKGLLFLSLGVLASAMIIGEQPTLKTVVLLAISIWAFARAYYFAFYVIEHYIDPGLSTLACCPFCVTWRDGLNPDLDGLASVDGMGVRLVVVPAERQQVPGDLARRDLRVRGR